MTRHKSAASDPPGVGRAPRGKVVRRRRGVEPAASVVVERVLPMPGSPIAVDEVERLKSAAKTARKAVGGQVDPATTTKRRR